jgi:hypothetical protein
MLLRESSAQDGDDVDLLAVTDAARASGLARGAQLNALVEACIGSRWSGLDEICRNAQIAIGADAVRDALIVAAGFNGITRVADATGIPLDPATASATAQVRRDSGIDRFDYAAKSARYDRA